LRQVQNNVRGKSKVPESTIAAEKRRNSAANGARHYVIFGLIFPYEESISMRKALQLCAVLLVTLLPLSAVDQTIYGYITCSICAAKGATDSHGDCMEKCLAKGADVVLVTDDTKQIVSLDNPDSVSGHHAHHVAVFGYFKNDAFHVVSVRIL
jgi:hypothetical protein